MNFLSVDCDSFGKGEEVGKGEFLELVCSGETIHTYHEDSEPDEYFGGFGMLHKEKRIRELWINGERHTRVYIDYIAKKKLEEEQRCER